MHETHQGIEFADAASLPEHGATPVKARIMYIVTQPITADYLLRGQLRHVRDAGFEVAVCTSPGPSLERVAEREGVEVLAVKIPREIAPFADLGALFRLVRVLRRWRPTIVNAGTPKAGLLGMLAARIVGVPVRLYTLRGLRLESKSGIARSLLNATERLAARCAHRVLAVSPSLAERAIELGIANDSKLRVLGQGGSNGVSLERFTVPTPAEKNAKRVHFGLDPNGPVIGFVGRLTRDKGIADLVAAIGALHESLPNAQLLVVGDLEGLGDDLDGGTVDALRSDARIHMTGFLADTPAAYQAMDVLVFPSSREGLPNAPLEAAATGIPVVGYRATGTVDAVKDGETGALVPIGDVAGLKAALLTYLTDPGLLALHGRAGRKRVESEFTNEVVWENLLSEYESWLPREGLQ